MCTYEEGISYTNEYGEWNKFRETKFSEAQCMVPGGKGWEMSPIPNPNDKVLGAKGVRCLPAQTLIRKILGGKG